MNWIKANITSVLIWVASLLIGGIGVYNSITSDTALLNSRVSAIEQRNDRADPLIERFYVVEQQERQSRESIAEIKETINRMEEKIDQILINTK